MRLIDLADSSLAYVTSLRFVTVPGYPLAELTETLGLTWQGEQVRVVLELPALNKHQLRLELMRRLGRHAYVRLCVSEAVRLVNLNEVRTG